MFGIIWQKKQVLLTGGTESSYCWLTLGRLDAIPHILKSVINHCALSGIAKPLLGSVNFNQVIIEIVNKEGELVTYLELEANPFKVGETINIQASNYDKSFWTVEEVRGDFIIEKIEHFVRKDYIKTQKINTVFTVSVQVSPV
jgi:hypothetical protein